MKKTTLTVLGAASLVVAAIALMSCGDGNKSAGDSTTGGAPMNPGPGVKARAGSISIDGSSTVYPIATALVEAFNDENPGVKITAGQKGTGGGIKDFANKSIDIADASRPIKESEIADCKKNGVEFVELPIAFDGLSIVVSKSNTWLNSITIDDLHKMWDKDSKVKTWKDVNPAWPDKPIKLFGPTNTHGTYEFFNEAVNKKKDNSRGDYQQCADYNALVAGVSKEEGSLGYVGYAYYDQNKDKLKLVPVDGGAGPVTPSEETIRGGTYVPLSRPLLMYVSLTALAKPEVEAFLTYTIEKGAASVKSQGYIVLPDDVLKLAGERLKAKTPGSVFANFKPGMKMEDVLKMESTK